MSHKYLDQLTLEELTYIHKTFFDSRTQIVVDKHVVHFYEDLFHIEVILNGDPGYTCEYDDFNSIAPLDNEENWLIEDDVQLQGYWNWMAQRFGMPYVLDLVQARLHIDLSKIKKPAPAKINKPANRLKQLLKGATDGKKQITRNDPELL